MRFCWSEPLKLKPGRVLARVDHPLAHLQLVEAVGDLLPDGLRRIQRIAGLVDVGELDRVAELELAAVRGLLAGDHPEQGRLARAVGADHPDDARARQLEREGLDQQPIAEPLGQVVRDEHHLAQARSRRDVDLDLVELDVALFGDQLLIARQPGLGLRASALRVRADPFELRGDRALAGLLGALFLGQARLLLLQPAGVVALVGDALAAVELEDPAGDVVEEVAVVGDRHDRALVLRQVLLQPGDRLGVEMVGGLVQQQQVRRAQQQPAQRHAPALAAGELARRRRPAGAGAARPSRIPAACRGSRRRRRRSWPGARRTPRPSPRSSWPRAR